MYRTSDRAYGRAYDQYTGYIEGSVGLALIPNVATNPFSVDTDGSVGPPDVGIFNGTVEGDYGSEFTFGGEVGLIGGPQFRFGLSYDYAAVSLDTVTVAGTLDGTPFVVSFSEDDVDLIQSLYSSSFDNIIHIAQANLYYDFTRGTVFTPYIGIGAGAAFIQKTTTELALSATVGARFAISERAYIGGKYRFMYIGETEDDLGIQFDPIIFHTFSAVVGIQFR